VLWTKLLSSYFPALQAAAPPKTNSSRVFALFLWRGQPILGLAARDIDKLGGLAEVAGTFGALALVVACHATIMPYREGLRTVCLEMGHWRIMRPAARSSHIQSRLPQSN
jgi:hypothetical protein